MAKLFDEIQLRSLSLKNRIMVSPMCQYQSEEDALVKTWHLVHYGSLALGGPGLVMVEATAVEPRGRITERDLGLYCESQIEGLKQVVGFAHGQGTKIGVQLAHAGRKAEVTEDTIAPSALRFSEKYKVPVAASQADLEDIRKAFVDAAKRAVEAGFDTLELHGAHGYLLNEFLSPISNKRTDSWGGSRENRLRFPLSVVEAVRRTIPETMPLGIRVSANEFSDEGYPLEDMIFYCQAFKAQGIDYIDVSGGGNVPVAPPKIYAGYQVPYADAVRHAVKVPVISVGMLDDARLADSIIQEGRADIVAVARGFLRNKHWALQAAKDLGEPVDAPQSYQRAW